VIRYYLLSTTSVPSFRIEKSVRDAATCVRKTFESCARNHSCPHSGDIQTSFTRRQRRLRSPISPSLYTHTYIVYTFAVRVCFIGPDTTAVARARCVTHRLRRLETSPFVIFHSNWIRVSVAVVPRDRSRQRIAEAATLRLSRTIFPNGNFCYSSHAAFNCPGPVRDRCRAKTNAKTNRVVRACPEGHAHACAKK